MYKEQLVKQYGYDASSPEHRKSMASSTGFKILCLSSLVVTIGLLVLSSVQDDSQQLQVQLQQKLEQLKVLVSPCAAWQESKLQHSNGSWRWGLRSLDELFDYMERPRSHCRDVVVLGGAPTELDGKHFMGGEKAMCGDPPFKLPQKGCLVYSFGVNNKQWSFEKVVAQLGCNVYVFDPEVDEDTLKQLDPRIKMYKYRIGDQDLSQVRSTNSIHEWRRMSSILDMIKQQNISIIVDYLKLDIKGDELNLMDEILYKRPRILRKFKQINMEINLGIYTMPTWKDVARYYRYFVLLEKRGFRLFSSRVNQLDHSSYLLKKHNRVVHSHYDLVWGKCDPDFDYPRKHDRNGKDRHNSGDSHQTKLAKHKPPIVN